MAVGTLGQIHLSVSDVERSVTFYRDVLGVPYLFTVDGQPMAFLQSGDVRIYLGVPSAPEFRSHCVLYFRVDDLDAELDRLAGLGVVPTAPPSLAHRDDRHELWVAGLVDPDGHRVLLMHERPLSA